MTTTTERAPQTATTTATAFPAPQASVGWYALIPLAASLYVLAYRRTRVGDAAWMHELFWLATFGVIASILVVLFRRRPSSGEGFVLAVVVGLVFFLPKLFRSPDYFNFYDELGHMRATDALLQQGGLFHYNALNPVVPYYPGLHAISAVLSRATGLSLFVTGTILMAVAHALVCAAVYLIAERLSRNTSVAVIAVLLYATTAGFFYFNAEFAYESLALPLVAVVLYLALCLSDGRRRLGTWSLAVGLGAVVVITHHASSYMLVLLLLVLSVASAWHRQTLEARSVVRWRVGLVCVLAGATLAWLLGVARFTFTYLGPLVRANLKSVPAFFGGRTEARQLFEGARIPTYEVLAGYGSVLIMIALVAVAGRRLWRAHDRSSASWALLVVSLGYLASLPLVALQADQVAKRTWTFSFLGAAPVAALVLAPMLAHARRRVVVAGVVALALLFVGGVSTRSGAHIRFAGPYQPSSDPRAMTPDVVGAARWMGRTQGPHNGFMGDRTVSVVFGAYGDQDPRQTSFKGYLTGDVFMRPTLSPLVYSEMERARAQYIVQDQRIVDHLPLTGFYFDRNEYGAYSGEPTVSQQALDKFDHPSFDRLYDNGNVRVFRYRGGG